MDAERPAQAGNGGKIADDCGDFLLVGFIHAGCVGQLRNFVNHQKNAAKLAIWTEKVAKMLLNDGGAVDTMLNTKLHLMSTNSPMFWIVVCLINVWKEMGWDAIIYLSAMAGIDQGLYEAAKVDGANRFARIWHITLPSIKPTVIVLLIMSIGGALNVGMERQMLLSNGIVQDHAMVLSWFAYIRGIGSNNYGLGTAIGMFQSVVGIILLFIANKIAGMLGESKLV